jgi:hypothetical protein
MEKSSRLFALHEPAGRAGRRVLRSSLERAIDAVTEATSTQQDSQTRWFRAVARQIPPIQLKL